MFCREHVAQLRDQVAEIHRRGGELVVVGNGSLQQAASFAADKALDFPLLTDPGRRSYRAARLRRGVGTTLGLRSLRNAARSLKQGHRQGAVQGDPWQQGGAFVIAPGGKILYRHIDQESGDHPDPQALLDALP